MAGSSDWLLTIKTILPVAITSPRRASELAALRVDPPYLQFHPNKVALSPDISFLPKVVTDFHLKQPIVLPTFFLSPSSPLEKTLHSLDVRRALAYYVDRTKSFRTSQRLFVATHGPSRGQAVSSQTISKWLVRVIHLAYELSHTPLPDLVRAHSTRVVATSTAFLRGSSLPDICRAATWSTPSTFAKHYRLDVHARAETSFGRAVLTSILLSLPTTW